MSETERLINAVREHPLLYNTSHADYKNARKREEAWYEISESFEGKYDVDWKKKWKNLKDSYVKYLKTEHTKTPKENSMVKRYKYWPWASQMEFVKPFCKLKKQSESMAIEKQQWYEYPDSDESLKGFPEDDVLYPTEEDLDKKFSNNSMQDQELIEPEIQHIDVDSLKFLSKEDNQLASKSGRELISSTYRKHNDIELILMGYAKTIKTFSPKRQTLVKFKFSQIIMEAELEQQEEDEINGPRPKKFKRRALPSSLSYESSN